MDENGSIPNESWISSDISDLISKIKICDLEFPGELHRSTGLL